MSRDIWLERPSFDDVSRCDCLIKFSLMFIIEPRFNFGDVILGKVDFCCSNFFYSCLSIDRYLRIFLIDLMPFSVKF